MNRRTFLQTTLAAGLPVAWPARQTAQQSPSPSLQQFDAHEPLVIERPRTGKPRAGQVVVAIQPHSDDIPLFAAGTVFKLIDEGAKAYLIRVTNDDMAGPGSYAETVIGQRARQDGRQPRCSASSVPSTSTTTTT